jgi:hypothetical protein
VVESRVTAAGALFLFVSLAHPIVSGASTAADRIVADSRAQRPLVAHVWVSLADNDHQGIVKVPKHLGNGQRAEGNLYWGARYGVWRYLQGMKGWTERGYTGLAPSGVLDRCVFETTIEGATLYVVAEAWDGARIREALAAFLEAAAGRSGQWITIGGKAVAIGVAAHVVAFVGHNGHMDFHAPTLREGSRDSGRAAIVLACRSQPHFEGLLGAAGATPILLTTGLMAPEAYTLEAALRAWFMKWDPEQVRVAAAEAYDRYQKTGRGAALRLFGSGARTP